MPDNHEDERRLFYVAITRAIEQVALIHPPDFRLRKHLELGLGKAPAEGASGQYLPRRSAPAKLCCPTTEILQILFDLGHIDPAGAFAGVLTDSVAGTFKTTGTGVFSFRFKGSLLPIDHKRCGAVVDTFDGGLHQINTACTFSWIIGKSVAGALGAAVAGIHFLTCRQFHVWTQLRTTFIGGGHRRTASGYY
jgi:hypothetical protein